MPRGGWAPALRDGRVDGRARVKTAGAALACHVRTYLFRSVAVSDLVAVRQRLGCLRIVVEFAFGNDDCADSQHPGHGHGS